MRKIVLIAIVTSFLLSHDLMYKVLEHNAVVITFSFGNGSDFSYNSYEVYGPNEKIPFSVGKTDKLSRVIFIPNKKGIWRVKVFSGDGHGKEIEIDIDKEFKIQGYSQTFFEKFQKILIGIAIIFAIFMGIRSLKRYKDEKKYQ